MPLGFRALVLFVGLLSSSPVMGGDRRFGDVLYDASVSAVPFVSVSWGADFAGRFAEYQSVVDGCLIGDSCGALEAWRGMIAVAETLPPRDQLDVVNAWVNRRFKTWRLGGDRRLGTLPEIFGSGRSAVDCDDVAFVKWASLVALGWRRDDLRLVAAFERVIRQDHAFLTVRWKGQVWILDHARSVKLMDEVSEYRRPLWATDLVWVWVYAQPGER